MSNKDEVKILYLEIIRKDEYEKWKRDPRFVGENLLKSRTPGEVPPKFINRFSISHINENFKAWHAKLPSVSNFYSSDVVRAMTSAQSNSSPFKFAYELDDLIWECEFSVKTRQMLSGVTQKTLVVHMPNDGYFYINGTEMEKFLGKVDKTGMLNARHRNTCYDGWKKLNKQVWEQLTPFKEFMLGWFGVDTDENRIEHAVLYHSDVNRVDLCMRHMDEHIGIEFSFEHSYPLGLEDDYWDTW